MPSIASYFLGLAALLAIVHGAAPAQEEDNSLPLAPSPRQTALGVLLRKRALESAVRAPRAYSYYEPVVDSPSKRGDDDYWIWMPAHGFMPVPMQEMDQEHEGQDGMGNLLRYG